MGDATLHLGDCLTVLPTLGEGSVDAVVTDPPYGLEFMGKEWDSLWRNHSPADVAYLNGEASAFTRRQRQQPTYRAGPEAQQWHQRWATAVLRVLRPGGYLLAFGGTRTFHRLACALEDAGFEMRDTLAYLCSTDGRVGAFLATLDDEQRKAFLDLYAPSPVHAWTFGSGFPKGRGCLKPAWEPILLCRRPGPRVLPLGVDECRIGHAEPYKTTRRKFTCGQLSHATNDGRDMDQWEQSHSGNGADLPASADPAGRWPANVATDGSGEVLEAFAAFGERGGGFGVRGRDDRGHVFGNGCGLDRATVGQVVGHGDTGTAARFFYTAKASRAERNVGLAGMQEQGVKKYGDGEGFAGRTQLPDGTWVNTDKANRKRAANHHPTVKPLALMEWLVKLITPPGSLCLDPFAGSGTTLVAAIRTGRRALGIEADAGYCEIARRRLASAEADASLPLFADEEAETPLPKAPADFQQPDLFAEGA